jgi:hypothetical protein
MEIRRRHSELGRTPFVQNFKGLRKDGVLECVAIIGGKRDLRYCRLWVLDADGTGNWRGSRRWYDQSRYAELVSVTLASWKFFGTVRVCKHEVG